MAQAADYTVYADGACIGNPGPGGWGAVVRTSGGDQREFSAAVPDTTNNRMEITAAIEALRRIPAGAAVILRTDSTYVVRTMNDGWKKRANNDLWTELEAEVARRNVRFEWIRGHAGDPMNELADRLANAAARGRLPDGEPADEAPRRDRAGASDAPNGQASALGLALGADERIARCAGCGGEFVTSSPAAPVEFCSLLACQQKARRRRNR